MSNEALGDQKKTGIKRAYLPLPVETPDDFICVKVQIPDGDEYLELLRTVLKSLTLWYNYARDETHRGKVIADLFRDAFLLPELGCDMNCEELLACIGPLFEPIYESLAQMTVQVETLVQQAEANATKAPGEIEIDGDEFIYAGSLAVVKEMDRVIKKVFTDTEMSAVDNASEALSILLELFPNFAGMTYDEGFELGNAYFENQAAVYNSDYPDFEVPAACDLMWFIINNGAIFDFNAWGDWLFTLQTVVPDNAAANIFTRYSPLRITFLNQIANLISPSGSLQTYFENLYQVYFAGAQTAIAVPEDCNDNELCGIVLDYVSQPADIDVSVGELDPTGFISSGILSDTAWIIADWTGIAVTDLERVRLVFDDSLVKAWQVYATTGFWNGFDTPVYIGGGLFAIDIVIDPVFTGTIDIINVRQHPIPNTTAFRLVRMELCEA